jgi:hypothetical protein
MDGVPHPITDPARARNWLTLSFVIFLVALVAGSWPRSVGDGGEYLATALNLAEVGTPWLNDADIARVRGETAGIRQLEGWDVKSSMKTSWKYGTHDFLHFWFYSAVAQPFVSLARAVGANPIYGFAAINIGLLVLAFWIALPRIGGWLTWLVFAGPIIWWADKPHTEPFTFSLLAIALLLLEEAPVWAVIAAGLAATQNPPVLAMVPFAAVALGARGAMYLRRPAVWIGLIAASAVGCAALVYYEMRYRTPSLLLSSTLKTLPDMNALLVVPFDTNLGLIGAFPAFFLVLLIALAVMVLRPKRFAMPAAVLALLTLPVFLMSFAQTGNMHHGGTPGMSRYALWLVPLGLPFLRELSGVMSEPLKTVTAVIAIVSATVSTFVFHPKHPDNYREPTWLATMMWTRYPAWSNPLPEIFVDVLDRTGAEQLPMTTAGCTKTLLIGRGDKQGMWPVACYPADIPPECRQANTLCYANLDSAGYTFAPTHDVQERFKYDPTRVWHYSMEPAVRRVLDAIGWRTLQPGAALGGASALRQIVGVDAVHTLEGPDRLVVAMLGTHESARLSFRLPAKMTAAFIDPETGVENPAGAFDGTPHDIWGLNVPANHDVLLLVLRAQ